MSAHKIHFLSQQQDPFAVELQSEVNDYFTQKNKGSKANPTMVAKSIFYLGGFVLMAGLILAHPASGLITLLLCALLGFFSAGIGLNIGHDAIHGAYAKSRRLNAIMGHSFTLIGAHEYNWRILHNVIHHSYTNIAGADGDLHPGGWFRFFSSPAGLKPYHRFQHLYAIPLYCLTSLVWVFKKDFEHIHKKEHYAYKKPQLPKGEFEFLIFSKLAYFVLFLGLPCWLGGYSVAQTLVGFVVLHIVQGLTLSLTFQLGHIVEGPRISHLSEQSDFESSYRHQLQGTANFAPTNKAVAWICGGLNHQIEHHLFPKICHVHYPALSAIVKKIARKHALPYYEFPTMRAALYSHFRVLKQAGAAL